jgi:hypothetical protein
VARRPVAARSPPDPDPSPHRRHPSLPLTTPGSSSPGVSLHDHPDPQPGPPAPLGLPPLDPRHRPPGIVPELVLRAEEAQVRAQHRYCDLAVEHVEAGNYRPESCLAIPLDALADFEGAAETPVTLESSDPDRTIVRWQDRGIPQSREYSLVKPVDRVEPMPGLPATWTSNPGELLDSLAEAAETGTPDSTRYALDMIQLQGRRGQLVATDGRQLLVRSGFRFPWTDDLLIKGRPIFGCRAIPRDQPVEVGRTDSHVFFRAGAWTVSCVIQQDARFPAAERAIPADSEVGTRLRLDADDARFLESAIGRLPGGEEVNGPVTLDLNGEVAVRAAASDQPKQVTELVLNRSSYAGSPLCISANRALLERALRLGCRELGFTGTDSAFVCRGADRIFAIQPLSGGSPPPADAELTRIESGAASGGGGRIPAHTESERRTMTVRESRNGHEPARPAERCSEVSLRTNETGGTSAAEPPGTSLAALIQEAEALHAALADAKSRTARLIAGLRRQRKQSRLVQETLKSLRELRLQDVVS